MCNRILWGLLATLAILPACSSEPEQPATIVIFAGQESDAFTRTPVPDRLTVRAIDLDGNATELVSVAWPASSFDIGDLDKNGVAAFEAVAEDAARTPLLRGQTVFYSLWSLAGYEIPVFVGRVDEFSRPAGALSIGRTGGTVGVVGAQFLVVSGGANAVDDTDAPVDAGAVAAYDLSTWNAVPVALILPRVPLSMPIVLGEFALLINDAGATWFDFSTYAQAEESAPAGIAFADVAGGEVVLGEDGTAYVVGATRSSSPSAAVLRVSTDLSLAALHLNTPRAGASATWVTDRGLVVAGGSADGAGVEVLAPDATAFAALPFPADPIEGAGIAAIDSARVLLAGGADPADGSPATTRVVDLGCSAVCVAQVLDASPDKPLRTAAVYPVRSDAALVVGEEQSSSIATRTAAFLIEGLGSTASIREIALREPRIGARSIALMDGMVGVVGGYDSSAHPVRSVDVFVSK